MIILSWSVLVMNNHIKDVIVARMLEMLNKLSTPKSKYVSDYDIDRPPYGETKESYKDAYIVYFRSNFICYLFITDNNLMVNKNWPHCGKLYNSEFIVPFSDPHCFDSIVGIIHTKVNNIANVTITLL